MPSFSSSFPTVHLHLLSLLLLGAFKLLTSLLLWSTPKRVFHWPPSFQSPFSDPSITHTWPSGRKNSKADLLFLFLFLNYRHWRLLPCWNLWLMLYNGTLKVIIVNPRPPTSSNPKGSQVPIGNKLSDHLSDCFLCSMDTLLGYFGAARQAVFWKMGRTGFWRSMIMFRNPFCVPTLESLIFHSGCRR